MQHSQFKQHTMTDKEQADFEANEKLFENKPEDVPPSMASTGQWEADPATLHMLDKAGINWEEMVANMDETLRRQEAAKPNNLNEGVFWGPFSQVVIACALFFLLCTFVTSYCQRRSEEYRTKYAVYLAKKKRREETRRQQMRRRAVQ